MVNNFSSAHYNYRHFLLSNSSSEDGDESLALMPCAFKVQCLQRFIAERLKSINNNLKKAKLHFADYNATHYFLALFLNQVMWHISLYTSIMVGEIFF